ncbi:MAG: HD domain-containing protein [Spirochaetales bacterium]|nr:HD domain-containing protein [Spirochaetales bacterium]
MEHPPLPLPDELKRVASTFAKANRQCWLVGGAVRDGILGRGSEDFDLATDAPPEEVVRLFRRTIPTGIKHGTITILKGKHQFETTTFRKDGDYSNGRHPDAVSYASHIDEDLARRDFTINAIAWDLINHRLFDPHDGQGDIQRGIIRAIGEASQRFEEDGLRSIRACRFASQLNFKVEDKTLVAITGALHRIPGLSAERIWEELKKILKSEKPSTALMLFLQTGLLKEIIPELAQCDGIEQKGTHDKDVLGHIIAVCDAASSTNLPLRCAALLHDVGKPQTHSISPEGLPTFEHHDVVGAKIAEKILRRLKTPNALRERVVRLIELHMLHYNPNWTDVQIRRFMALTGRDYVDDVIALHRADLLAIGAKVASQEAQLTELEERVEMTLKAQVPLTIRDLAIDGRTLMKELKKTGGPWLGDLLDDLLNHVLEDPTMNQEEPLLAYAKKWLSLQL